jgi:hypothetical protein
VQNLESEAIFGGEITWLQLASAWKSPWALAQFADSQRLAAIIFLDFGCPTNPSTPRPPTQQVALEVWTPKQLSKMCPMAMANFGLRTYHI